MRYSKITRRLRRHLANFIDFQQYGCKAPDMEQPVRANTTEQLNIGNQPGHWLPKLTMTGRSIHP